MTTKIAQTTSKQSRLEARIAPDVHALLKRAAEIEGRTMSDFVVAAASAAARETIERAQIINLTAEQSKFVLDLLDNPPPIAPAMERAVANHKALIEPR